jgi:hypothetical protein
MTFLRRDKFLALPGIEPNFHGRPARSLVTMPSELSRIPRCCRNLWLTVTFPHTNELNLALRGVGRTASSVGASVWSSGVWRRRVMVLGECYWVTYDKIFWEMKLNVYCRVKLSTMGNQKFYLYSQSEEFLYFNIVNWLWRHKRNFRFLADVELKKLHSLLVTKKCTKLT